MKKFREFVDGRLFNNFILVVIIINAVLLGLQTSKTVMENMGGVLEIVDEIFLGIFILEMILKIIAYGLSYFKDGWNWFDMIIILLSVLSSLAFLSAFRVFRIFRVFRSLKAMRGMRMMSSLRHLRVIVQAIGRSIPSIAWTALLLVLIYYIFSIIGVSMFGEEFPDWFGNIGKSMYTLFQVMTLESWSMGISRPVMEVFSYAWMYFVPFVLISSFIVMNVVVGIVVNAISEVAEATKIEKKTAEAEQEELPADNNAKIAEEIAEVRKHLEELEKLLDK
ncbi:MAG: ion transporter [Lachnospiraceae bacterium]|nr:ion transporter [Lachnospiraceae bacterium]